jgi:solute carrier family 25 phosphate transporter 23/24/25/41
MRASIKTISRDGGLIAGLWKGNGLNIMKTIPESLTRMLVLGRAKVLVARFENVSDGVSISPGGRFFAGASGGAASTFICYPLDVVRIRSMANIPRDTESSPTPSKQLGRRTYSTLSSGFLSPFKHHQTFEIVQQMWKTEGLPAFYRGLATSLLSIVPFAGTNLMVFETLKTRWMQKHPDEDRPPLQSILTMGCVAGAFSETLVYPLHVLRSRMSSQGTISNPERYSNTWDCAQKVYSRNGGYHAFYRGLLPTLAKAAPGIGVGFTLFEVALRMLLPDEPVPIPK